MTGKNATQERITPEEAIALFRYASTEEMYRVKALYDMYMKENEVHNAPLWDMLDLWDLMSILSFVYDTGRVQGMREERAKRANTAKEKEIAA